MLLNMLLASDTDFGTTHMCMNVYLMNPFLSSHVEFDCMYCRCYDLLCPGEDYEEKIADLLADIDYLQWNSHTITNMVMFSIIIFLGCVGECDVTAACRRSDVTLT